jgi:hypothetical protein
MWRLKMTARLRLIVSLIASAVGANQAVAQDTARTLYTIDASVLGKFTQADALTIDVLWCDRNGASESNKNVATELAASLATYARLKNPGLLSDFKPDTLIKTVRLRPLPNSERLDSALLGTVMIVPDGARIKEFASTMAGFTGSKVEIQTGGSIPNYVKLLACADAKSRVPGRVYFLIARQDQEAMAREAIRKLTEASTATVLNQVENVGTRAPSQSEVKYFFEEDAGQAEAIALQTSQIIKSPVIANYLPQLSNRATPGTIEAWFGLDYAPIAQKKFLLCEGEYRDKCPSGAEWVPCYFPIAEWTKSKPNCATYDVRRITTAPGNKCGYGVSEVTCNAPTRGVQTGWSDTGTNADWAGRDYAFTSTAIPKYDVRGVTLCSANNIGYVAVCWDQRPEGYPTGIDVTDIPTGGKPPRWCTYKDNRVKLSTPPDGHAPPGRVYVCAQSVPR